jgi:hypothetical protein
LIGRNPQKTIAQRSVPRELTANYWFAQIGDAALSIIAPLAFAIGANQ